MAPGESFRELVKAFLDDRRVAAEARREGGSEGTLKFYANALQPLIEWSEANSVTPEAFGRQHLTAYLTYLIKQGQRPGWGQKTTKGRKLKPTTLTAYRSMAQSLLLFAENAEFITKAYKFPKQPHPQPSPRWLSPEQIEAVMKACKTARERAIISLLVDSGLRRAELCALSWNDIEWKAAKRRGVVHVRMGKGAKPRDSYFFEATWTLLQKYGASRPRGAKDPVFLAVSDESRLSDDGLGRILRRLGQASGVGRLTPHMLRHSSVRMMLDRGMAWPAIQKALGHATAGITLTLYGSYNEPMTEDAFFRNGSG